MSYEFGQKFFRDNLKRISATDDPISSNFKKGLLALCEEMGNLAARVETLQKDVDLLKKKLRP